MKSITSYLIIATTLCLGFVSCAVNPQTQQTMHNRPAMTPTHSALAIQSESYRLGYGDVLEVKFFNNGEYNETVAVRPDGNISLQRVGDIKVVDMSVSDLDSLVTTVYGEILVDPEVTVIVREFGGQMCYVMGEVEKPGTYSLTKGMSILRAIAAAGGPKTTAKMNSIILVRGNGAENAQVARIDLNMSTLDNLIENDRRIRAFDVVYVPRTFIADLDAFVSQVYDVVIPPLDLYTRYTWFKEQLD